MDITVNEVDVSFKTFYYTHQTLHHKCMLYIKISVGDFVQDLACYHKKARFYVNLLCTKSQFNFKETALLKG